MWPITLSGRLPITALVSRYLTNKLIGHRALPGQKYPTVYKQDDAIPPDHPVLPAVSSSYPDPEGTLPMHYSPFRHSTRTPKGTFAFDLHA